jgi:hypothetical protein
MRSVLDDPKLWRDCALDALAAAEQMPDPGSKRLMLGIADGYQQLAVRSEKQRAKRPPKHSRLGTTGRLRADAPGAKILTHPSFAKRDSLPRSHNGAKAR